MSEDLKKSGVYLLVVDDNTPAINLYKKTGFDFIKKQLIGSKSYDIMAKGEADKDQLRKMNFG